jgi:signal transduction histidine kinase
LIITITGRRASGSELENNLLKKDTLYTHIRFADNGIGFEPQYNERIFELFQRLHSKNEYKGTGIGLAIVKRIVDNHNGVVTAKGNEGVGATFDIYLPEKAT